MRYRRTTLILAGLALAAGLVGSAGTAAADAPSMCPDNTVCLYSGRDYTGAMITLSPDLPWQNSYDDLHELPCVLADGTACVSGTFPDYSNGRWSDQVSSSINNTRELYCWWTGANATGRAVWMNMWSRQGALSSVHNDVMRSIRPC
jgi:hypothetical protein